MSFSGLTWGDGVFVALADKKIITSTDGVHWVERVNENSAETEKESFTAVIYGKNEFLAFGSHNSLAASKDGISWRLVAKPQADRLRSPRNLFWDGKMYIAFVENEVYDNGEWKTMGIFQMNSIDGIKWAEKSLGNYSYNITDIAKLDNKYLCGDFSSTDGYNWKLPQNDLGALNSVAAGGSRYVAVGDKASILTSGDGLKWDKVNVSSNIPYTDVAYIDNAFYLVGRSAFFYYSADGVKWDSCDILRHNDPVFMDEAAHYIDLKAISGYKDKLVIAGDKGSLITIYKDGEKWSGKKFETSVPLKDVANNGSVFVAVGEKGAMFYSADGDAWKKISVAGDGDFYRILWDGQSFIASGYNMILKSGNGMDWTQLNKIEIFELPDQNRASQHSLYIYDSDYNGKVYVLSTAESGLYYSYDGLKWLKSPSNLGAYSISTIAHNGKLFAGFGGNRDFQNALATSTDGIHWTLKKVPSELDPAKLIWNGKQFVAVGGNGGIGRIWTSVDGSTWKEVLKDKNPNTFWDIAFNKDKLIALKFVTWGGENSGFVYISTNGTKWTRTKTNINACFEKIAWCKDRFIAFATDYKSKEWRRYLLTSQDGVKWTELPIRLGLDDKEMTDMLYGNGKYLIIVNDAMYSSIDGKQWSKDEIDPNLVSGNITYDEKEKRYIIQSTSDILLTSDFSSFRPLGNMSYSIVSDGEDYYNGMNVSLDLSTWEPINADIRGYINDMAAANGKYIFVCSDGKILVGVKK